MFDQYRKANCRASFSNVPVELLGLFRASYPGRFKIRYRGPRAHRVKRSFISKASTCLKADAVGFSAYLY